MTWRRATALAKGLTLVEVLIALTLMGIVSVIAAGALHLAVDTRGRVDARADAVQQLRASSELLRSRLSQAHPATWRRVPGDTGRVLAGTAKELHFVAPLPARWADGRLYLFSVESERDDSGARLMLRYRRLPENPGDPVPQEPRGIFVLIDSIADHSWSYFGRAESTQENQWHETWEQERLPQLIRLAIEPADPRIRPWPAWVVAVTFGGMSASDLRVTPRRRYDENE